MMRSTWMWLILFFCSAALLSASDELLVKNNQTILFIGENNTTDFGKKPGGYPNLVVSALTKSGVTGVKAVICGFTFANSRRIAIATEEQLKRMTPAPDVVVVDPILWDAFIQVSQEDELKNLESIRNSVKKVNAKLILGNGMSLANVPKTIPFFQARNQKLAEFAKANRIPVADFFRATDIGGAELFRDERGLNGLGHQEYARAILRAMGMMDPEIHAVSGAWDEIPGTMTVPVGFSTHEVNYYRDAAKVRIPEKELGKAVRAAALKNR